MQIWIHVGYVHNVVSEHIPGWMPGYDPWHLVGSYCDMAVTTYRCVSVEGAAKAVARTLGRVHGPGAVRLLRHGVRVVRSPTSVRSARVLGDPIVAILSSTDCDGRKSANPRVFVTEVGSKSLIGNIAPWEVTASTRVIELETELRLLTLASTIT